MSTLNDLIVSAISGVSEETESEVEKITDMTLEQAQAYIWNNDYPDDIEIV